MRRRTKTQGLIPTPEALVIMVWGTLATGGIRLRKFYGFRAMAQRLVRQAA
jgi:hypothetical protein